MIQEIDYESVRKFWLERSIKTCAHDESLVNFEEDAVRLALKMRMEIDVVMPIMKLLPEMRVLDLGAGIGQWSLRFAPYVKNVTAVDYQPRLIEKGLHLCSAKGIDNVHFIECPVQEYKSAYKFERVFMSGILMYLNDAHIMRMIANIYNNLASNSVVVLREPSSILAKRHVINKNFSNELKVIYSAIYRTENEFISLFDKGGFALVKSGNIFPDGTGLDKFPETRLRYYSFVKNKLSKC